MSLTSFKLVRTAVPASEVATKKNKWAVSCMISMFLLNCSATAKSPDNTTTLKTTKSKQQTKNQSPHIHPWDKKFYLNGLTITPGGFFAGEGVWRSRNMQSGIGSNYNSIPLANSPLYYMHEGTITGRQSRSSILVEGLVSPKILLSGFYDGDFTGSGTANENESNSFDLRIRNFYATADWIDSGWHLLAGQSWSLLTTTNQGIKPRTEATPPTIDSTSGLPGFIWKRQGQVRLAKNFGERVWMAISAENPQFTAGGSPCGIVNRSEGTAIIGTSVIDQYCFSPGAGTLSNTNNFAINYVPDVIGKLVYESKFYDRKIHLEGFGLYRQFYDRVYTTTGNSNMTSTGWGAGSGAVIEAIPKRLDIQGNIMFGHGIGTYGTGQLPDTTLTIDGSLTGIPELIFLVGATAHLTSDIDVFVFGGKEQEQSKYFQVGNTYYGYGIPTANTSGCTIEGGTCAANTKEVWQIATGVWNKLYKGPFGELKAGLEYSYTQRILFSGNNGPSVPEGNNYSANENMFYFSFRYFPFAEVKPSSQKA